MNNIEILIRYKCEKCDGDGAKRDRYDRIIGNCSDCGGNGKHQEWIEYEKLIEIVNGELICFSEYVRRVTSGELNE